MKSRKGRKRRKKKRSFSRQTIRSFLLQTEKEAREERRNGACVKNRKRKKAEKAKTEQHAFTVEK